MMNADRSFNNDTINHSRKKNYVLQLPEVSLEDLSISNLSPKVSLPEHELFHGLSIIIVVGD